MDEIAPPAIVNDVFRLVHLADSFTSALSLVDALSNVDRSLHLIIGRPGVVLSAFASELYMKALILLTRQKSAPRIHNLEKLYVLLSSQDKKMIEAEWNIHSLPLVRKFSIERNKPIPNDLRDVLRIASKAFEQWRYPDKSKLPDYLLHSFPAIVRQRVILKSPAIEANALLTKFRFDSALELEVAQFDDASESAIFRNLKTIFPPA